MITIDVIDVIDDDCDIELPSDMIINDVEPSTNYTYEYTTKADKVFDEYNLDIDNALFRNSKYFSSLPEYNKIRFIDANLEFQFYYKSQVKRVIDTKNARSYYILERPDIMIRFSQFVVNDYLPSVIKCENDLYNDKLVDDAKFHYNLKYIIPSTTTEEIRNTNPNPDNSVNENVYI